MPTRQAEVTERSGMLQLYFRTDTPGTSMRHRALIVVLALLGVLPSLELRAQRPIPSAAVHAFVTVDSPIVALTHVRVIDGTGAPAREDQTLIIRDGRIAALGAFPSVAVP